MYEAAPAGHVEGGPGALVLEHVTKLSEAAGALATRLGALEAGGAELRRALAAGLDEAGAARSRLRAELQQLSARLDALHALHAGKEDDSPPGGGALDADSCHSGFSSSSKVTMTTGLDRDTIRAAYEDVRSDGSPTDWAVFKFEAARIVCAARGADFAEFRTQFGDDDRAFGYLRLQMGDEMSKRKKFLFVTWVGPNVSVINRAKMSTDKAIIKDIISNFAVELQLENQAEIDIEQFKEALNRAGGANYGTGVRDL